MRRMRARRSSIGRRSSGCCRWPAAARSRRPVFCRHRPTLWRRRHSLHGGDQAVFPGSRYGQPGWCGRWQAASGRQARGGGARRGLAAGAGRWLAAGWIAGRVLCLEGTKDIGGGAWLDGGGESRAPTGCRRRGNQADLVPGQPHGVDQQGKSKSGYREDLGLQRRIFTPPPAVRAMPRIPPTAIWQISGLVSDCDEALHRAGRWAVSVAAGLSAVPFERRRPKNVGVKLWRQLAANLERGPLRRGCGAGRPVDTMLERLDRRMAGRNVPGAPVSQYDCQLSRGIRRTFFEALGEEAGMRCGRAANAVRLERGSAGGDVARNCDRVHTPVRRRRRLQNGVAVRERPCQRVGPLFQTPAGDMERLLRQSDLSTDGVPRTVRPSVDRTGFAGPADPS